jgi:hypothetical protein
MPVAMTTDPTRTVPTTFRTTIPTSQSTLPVPALHPQRIAE